MQADRKVLAIVVAAVCVLYVAARLWRLTDSCLWFDEIFGVHAAEHEWSSIFWFVAQDLIHPPLFYVLLKVWISVGGESLLWLRLFPVLFSTLALFPFLHLCRELKLNSSTKILALVLLAVNGSLIKYAQEVRMYALLYFFSLFSLWLFARFYIRGKNIWFLTIVNVLLVYTHYFGWFVIAAEVAIIFIFQRVKIRHVLIMFGIALVTYVPWIPALARAAAEGSDVTQNIGWMSRPGVRAVLDLAFDLVEPFYYQQTSVNASTLLYITVPLLAVIAVGKILFLVNRKYKEDGGAFYLMSIFVLLPVGLAFIVSWVAPVSIWGARHLIIVFAPVAILIAMFLSAIETRWFRAALYTAVGLLSVAAFALQLRSPTPQFAWCELENAGRDIHETMQGPIFVFEDLAAYHLWFSFRHGRNTKEWTEVIKVDGLAGMQEDKAYFLPRGFEDVRHWQAVQFKPEQMWIVYRAKGWDPTAPPIASLPGYRIADRKVYDADLEKVLAVFLVKEKQP